MEEALKSALDTDEIILFKGQAESFETLDKTNKNPFVIRTVLTVLICISLIVAYAVSTIPIENFKILVPLVVAAVAALIITSVFRDSRKIRKQQYVITSKRLIRQNSDEVSGLPYSAIEQYLFKMDEDGHTSLLIGKDGTKTKSSNWRKWGASSLSVSTESGKCDQAVFYAVPKPDQFRKIFVGQMEKCK